MNASARVFALLVALTVVVRAESPESPQSERIVLPAGVIPERYDIKVTPNAQALTFAGEAKIAIGVQKATDRIVLNAADLTIDRMAVNRHAV